MNRRKLVVTANFEKNLDVIEQFNDPPSLTIVASLKELDRTLSTLKRLPDIGRVVPVSDDGDQRRLVTKIVGRLGGGSLRQTIVGELVLLYLSGSKSVVLLAVKHHRQREFALG